MAQGRKKAVQSFAIPTRFTEGDLTRVERARGLLGLRSRSAFVREAVLEKLEAVESSGIVQVRDLSLAEATKLIDAYLRKHPGRHYVSDIVERLGIEPSVAFEAAERLIGRGRARVGKG